MTATDKQNKTHGHQDGLTDGEGQGGDGQFPGLFAPTVLHRHVGARSCIPACLSVSCCPRYKFIVGHRYRYLSSILRETHNI